MQDDNLFREQILELVARGSTIIAELQRLSKHIPDPFSQNNSIEKLKYSGLLSDFSYFKNMDMFEERIRESDELRDLDEEMRDNYVDLLERFYNLFLSITNYWDDYSRILTDLAQNAYIQNNFEMVITDPDGKRLVVEGLYLYGSILLVIDILIPGNVREAIIISYYRYKGQATIQKIGDICRLLANTGFGGDKKPITYPVEYFRRNEIKENIVAQIIDQVKDDDIYQQLRCYPSAEHRSVALSNQASIIFVLLYFHPTILEHQVEKMREIVSKHFPDNWVIPIYQGFVVDLTEYWKNFTGARTAIMGVITPERVRDLSGKQKRQMDKINEQMNTQIMEGKLSENYVLDFSHELMHILRSANVAIRWVILHSHTTMKKYRETVKSICDNESLFTLLMKTSEYETKLKGILQFLVESKSDLLEKDREDVCDKMNECAEIFAGNRNIGKIQKDESYEKWFRKINKQLTKVNFKHSGSSGRKIHTIIGGLENISAYPLIDSNPQLSAYVSGSIATLRHMGKVVNIKMQILVTFATISDFSYAWNLLDDYLQLIHDEIKKKSRTVLQLRSVFLKLASILNLPLLRLIEADSPDLMNVSQYYSSELVQFVGRVLSIIPTSIFDLLKKMCGTMTNNKLKSNEAKIPKEHLLEYAMLEERFHLAKWSHRVSLFAKGMLTMDKCLMGIIEVDPKDFLITGIRNEIIHGISKILHKGFHFKTLTIEEFEKNVKNVSVHLDNLQLALEYVQDIIGIEALKMWNHELARVIQFNIDREANPKKFEQEQLESHVDGESNFIQIPKYDPLDNESMTFMGRLLKGILSITSPNRNVIYMNYSAAWYDYEGKEAFSPKTIGLLLKAMGIVGVNGLDTLICYRLATGMKKFSKMYHRLCEPSSSTRNMLDRFCTEMGDYSTITETTARLFENVMGNAGVMIKTLVQIIENLGHMQLIRKTILQQLSFVSKVESKGLYQAIDNFNKALILQMDQFLRKKEEDDPDKQREEQEQFMNLIEDISKYSDRLGLTNPLHKIYTRIKFELPYFAAVLSLCVIHVLSQLTYERKFVALIKKKGGVGTDSMVFLAGVLTVLKHMHSEYTKEMIAFLTMYAKAIIVRNAKQPGKKTGRIPIQATNVLCFLEELCKMSGYPLELIKRYISRYFFDSFSH